MKVANYDFSGWATKNNILCSDGRTIRKDAFKDCDGKVVPLVWNHQHDEVHNVLGHALLENKDDGVYAYCSFNDTESGQAAKRVVQHGDVVALSIYANQLKQKGGDVIHGLIREVSLVLAGANKGAYIDAIMQHGVSSDEEAVAYFYDEEQISFAHAEEETEEPESEKGESEEMTKEKEEILEHSEEKTVKDVVDSMTEEQKKVLYFLVGEAAKGGEDEKANEDSKDEGEEDMKHNVFDQDNKQQDSYLTHSDMEAILKDAKRIGSLKEAFEAYTDGGELAHDGTGTEYSPNTATYGIDGIDWLFPEARTFNKIPDFIKRDQTWVPKVMNAASHSPFSRVKSMFANITENDARAKGYIKGHQKTDEVFTLLKRTTTPQTIYKRQKLDRDDIIDITDFDVVSWIKGEMRMMLDEEIARAGLIGDGRTGSSDDKISEDHIRPIYNDEDLYTIKAAVEVASTADDDDIAKEMIRTAVKARKDYKGSGNPTLFTTEEWLTNMLLLEDGIGHRLYKTETELATAMRVKEIVTVPVMEGLKLNFGTGASAITNADVYGIIVNMTDYNFGADKGGAVSLFDDFDIDYNQQKYLIETRCSGALIKPYSAITLYKKIKANS